MDTWEKFQARLFHLAYLAEELPRFVARPPAAWLYRQIAREADMVARIAIEYVAEAERAKLTNPAQGSDHVMPALEGDPDAVSDAYTAEQTTTADAAGVGGDAR